MHVEEYIPSLYILLVKKAIEGNAFARVVLILHRGIITSPLSREVHIYSLKRKMRITDA